VGPSFVTAVVVVAVDVATQLLELPRFKPTTEFVNSAACLNHSIGFHFTRQPIAVVIVTFTATLHRLTKTF
jgi:hypothetical protein